MGPRCGHQGYTAPYLSEPAARALLRASTTPAVTTPKAMWSAICGPRGRARILGKRGPTTPRSRAAIATPARAPNKRGRRGGSNRAMTTPHISDSARWTGPAASKSVRSLSSSCGKTIEPAARVASNGSPPEANASTVDGIPLRTAEIDPAINPSASVPRSTDTPDLR